MLKIDTHTPPPEKGLDWSKIPIGGHATISEGNIKSHRSNFISWAKRSDPPVNFITKVEDDVLHVWRLS